jgi:hypothetical protein
MVNMIEPITMKLNMIELNMIELNKAQSFHDDDDDQSTVVHSKTLKTEEEIETNVEIVF